MLVIYPLGYMRQEARLLAGKRLVSRVDPARLGTAFTVLLVAVAAYSLARSLPGLA